MTQILRKGLCGCGATLKPVSLPSSMGGDYILFVLMRGPNLAGLYHAHINMQIELEYRMKWKWNLEANWQFCHQSSGKHYLWWMVRGECVVLRRGSNQSQLQWFPEVQCAEVFLYASCQSPPCRWSPPCKPALNCYHPLYTAAVWMAAWHWLTQAIYSCQKYDMSLTKA